MNMWANNTGLEFIESNIGNRLFIIQTTDSNSSYVGCLKNGPQDLEIANYIAGVAAHEIGHAIGLMHEHQRSDSLPNTRYYQEYQLGNETRFSEVRYVATL